MNWNPNRVFRVITQNSIGVNYDRQGHKTHLVYHVGQSCPWDSRRGYYMYLGLPTENAKLSSYPVMDDIYYNRNSYNTNSNNARVCYSDGTLIRSNGDNLKPGSKFFIFNSSVRKLNNNHLLGLAKIRFDKLTSPSKDCYDELDSAIEKSFDSSSLYNADAVSDLLTLELLS